MEKLKVISRSEKKKTTKLFALILINLALLIPTGCSLSGRSEPPALKISAGEATVQAVRTTYSWQNGNTGIEADGLHPLDMAKELPVLLISENTTADLAFDTMPDQIEILAWKSSTAGMAAYDEPDFRFSLVSDHTVKLPSDDRYIFSVHAIWEIKDATGGDAYYGFASVPIE